MGSASDAKAARMKRKCIIQGRIPRKQKLHTENIKENAKVAWKKCRCIIQERLSRKPKGCAENIGLISVHEEGAPSTGMHSEFSELEMSTQMSVVSNSKAARMKRKCIIQGRIPRKRKLHTENIKENATVARKKHKCIIQERLPMKPKRCAKNIDLISGDEEGPPSTGMHYEFSELEMECDITDHSSNVEKQNHGARRAGRSMKSFGKGGHVA